jgi:ABC-type sugar transport system substrate-binding protein
MRTGRPVPAALAAFVAGAAVAQAEPVKLRIGWIVPASDSPFLVFKTEGIAKHAGESCSKRRT